MEVELNRSAKHKRAVVLAADNNYFPFAIFVFDQIARAHPTRTFDFCLLTQDNVVEHPLIDYHEIRIIRFKELSVASKLPEKSHITLAAYFRVFAPEILQESYDRILYLDCDMYCRRGDITELMNVDLGPYVLAAVREPKQYLRKNYIRSDMLRLGGGYYRYFNSGLLLIDTARFTEESIREKVIDIATKTHELDQSVLNAVLQGKWAEISVVWNWLYGFPSKRQIERFNPAIVHFAGRRKAWKEPFGKFQRSCQHEYIDFFQQHFPAYDMTKFEQSPGIYGFVSNILLKFRNISKKIRHTNHLKSVVALFDGDFDVKYK